VRRRAGKCFVKSLGSTKELRGILLVLRKLEAGRTIGGAVECVDINRNAESEDSRLGLF
jgi:hypothetical protein